MPGLKELEQFRDELSHVGKEQELLAERGESYEVPPLPSINQSVAAQVNVDDLLASIGSPDEVTLPEPVPEIELPPATDETSAGTSFDDLLASLPLDLPGAEAEAPAPASVPDSPAEDDFGLPEALLSGFGAEIEQGRVEDAASSSDFTVPDFDLPAAEPVAASADFDLPDFSSVTEAPEAEAVEELGDASELPDSFTDLMNAPSELAPEAASEIPDLPADFSMPDFGIEESAAPDFGVELPPGSDAAVALPLDLSPDIGDAPRPVKPVPSPIQPSAPVAPAGPGPASIDEIPRFSSSDADFADFTVPDDRNVPEPAAGSESPAELDGFDGFSLDENFLKTSIDTGSSVDDEFHIPGFSDFTSGPSRPSVSDLPSGGARGKKDIPLKISDGDFQTFLANLSAFPLNLRIAVEEYLSGEDGTDIQKMDLVHQIINRGPVRKIAQFLEKALDRAIPIPRDFEKKSVADWESEKGSLRYVFFNKIVPAAILFTIVATLTFCVVYLTNQFVVRPIAAERTYRKGYAAIADERYTQSLSIFDDATKKWQMKRWYFKYARAYREKKQYLTAEIIYERLLNQFKNDKKGGLEYAEMLRTELRNFEKAETVLRRRVLDNHVNDPDGLLALGDTYLDWADEDPSKFEEARKVYASLIELYGRDDEYLVRMMRYFIRTDNLAEVLPLKERFVRRRARIGAEDLVELGGYLLEKRYEPKPGDSEALRSRIEDVRSLLERGKKADPSIPEAHYNMGRFFVYNYKDREAISSLSEALRRFDAATAMSPRRVIRQVDAYRLLGEALARDKEYLKAQDLYAQGITLYQRHRENRTARPDPRVGVLYADYADIHYFISGDLDEALANYERALAELNDTPSVRYRVGYIQYRKGDYEAALRAMTVAYAEISGDENLLYAIANVLYRRGDYFASQGHYEALMERLEAERLRKGIVFPQARIDHGEFVERYMHASNNLGATLSRLAARTGDSRKNARALALLAESNRAWDALTRNPETLVRAKGTNLAFLNVQNVTHPRSDYQPEIYADIPKTLEGEKVLQQKEDQ